MSGTTGIAFTRYFFYTRQVLPLDVKTKLVALAYATARAEGLAPKEILIRSGIHDTTTEMGRHIKDPKGWHATFAFKFADEVDREFHYTSHGYTSSKHNYTLREAVSKPPKPDSTPRGGKRSGKVVWAAEDVTEWKDSPIGYSHLGE